MRHLRHTLLLLWLIPAAALADEPPTGELLLRPSGFFQELRTEWELYSGITFGSQSLAPPATAVAFSYGNGSVLGTTISFTRRYNSELQIGLGYVRNNSSLSYVDTSYGGDQEVEWTFQFQQLKIPVTFQYNMFASENGGNQVFRVYSFIGIEADVLLSATRQWDIPEDELLYGEDLKEFLPPADFGLVGGFGFTVPLSGGAYWSLEGSTYFGMMDQNEQILGLYGPDMAFEMYTTRFEITTGFSYSIGSNKQMRKGSAPGRP